jgi:hypothetical protein
VKLIGMILLVAGMGGVLSAGAVPEIDPGAAGTGIALLAGTILVLQSRRRK